MNGSTLTMQGPSGALEVDVRPGCGGEIAQIRFEDLEILATWPEPGPRPDGAVFEGSQAVWLESYRGGWQELLPNAGAASRVGDVTYSFHGSASSQPWTVLEHGNDRAVLKHVVDKPRLSLRRTITVSDAEVSVKTIVSNVGRRAEAVLWGHHPAFTLPADTSVFLDGDDASGLELDGLSASHFEVREAGMGAAVLRRPDGMRVELSWSSQEFPFMWIWTERDSAAWPFSTGVALIAIEPQTSSEPDGVGSARERGEALEIAAGTSVSRSVRLSVSRSVAAKGR